jgi:hypothetical protein
VRLAVIGPLWAELLVRFTFFTTRQAAQRRLSILEDKAMIHQLVPHPTDVHHAHRPSALWCARRIADQNVQHEVDAMLAFYAFWPRAYALAGIDTDQTYRADLDLTIAGRIYRVEIDRQTERPAQLKKTLAKYDACQNTVLFITLEDWRVREALTLTTNPRLYATTLSRVVSDPWSDHWRNHQGQEGHVADPVAVPVAEGRR